MHMDVPFTFGHENIGIVEHVGHDVATSRVGDRVIVTYFGDKPANNGEGVLEGGFGFSDPEDLVELGAFQGGQAEYMLVLKADSNFLKLPPGKELELDYILLADIFPTAWFALKCVGQVLGDTAVVFGAGLFCAYSALLRRAIRVYSVDNIPSRVAKPESIGAIPINFDFDPADLQILKREPNGVDRACDCVGSECVDEYSNNIENLILTQAVNVVKTGGGIGVIGVFLTHGPEAASASLKQVVRYRNLDMSIFYFGLWT
ncbi:hypothetical protein G7Y89_g11574 [Cudoniella acicularis]|uniref:Alcohol dehydrogenase-like N-terminal domain-containing protein n=1 Tax=Cudoniella acicularis TaxID=354080 RepID=A0A8H4RC42_9HELO|nr:hypothetical protein G7Y89_g11574 [Cudoniella acicularis]